MSHEEDVGVVRRQRGRPPKFNTALQTDVSLIEGEQRGQHNYAPDTYVEQWRRSIICRT